MKKLSNENGVVIVEATFVFPIMFLVIFLMLVAGNAYYQKCRVESFASRCALNGASYCADPLLDYLEDNKIPNLKDVDVKPYRYFIGGMNDVVSDIDKKISKKINNLSTGLFSGMRPKNKSFKAKFNNAYIYSTFSIDVDYDIVMPVRLLFSKDDIKMSFSSRYEVPVSDTTEFIRNVDMVDDYLESTGAKEKINEVISKAKEWFGK